MIEISPFLVYLITRLNCANNLVAASIMVSGGALIVSTILYIILILFDDVEDIANRRNQLKTLIKRASIITGIF